MTQTLKPIVLGMLGVVLALLIWGMWEDHETAVKVRGIIAAQEAQMARQPAPPPQVPK